MTFFEENRDALAVFAAMSQKVGARNDYVQGGGGNTSVKLTGGRMAIKASGYCLADISEDSAYAVLNCSALQDFYYNSDPIDFEDAEAIGAAKTKENIIAVEGIASLRPSVEAGFHSLLDTYVIHTHSIYSNLASCAKECESILKQALAGVDYDYVIIPYTDPGTRLSFVIRDALAEKRAQVLFLVNHGVVVHENDAERCIEIHEDLNKRLAAYFKAPFEELDVKICEEGYGIPEAEGFYSNTANAEAALLSDSLFPDQAVFFKDCLVISADAPEEGKCSFDWRMAFMRSATSGGKARVVAEVIAAVTFIRRYIQEAGFSVQTMSESGLNFINNWESEKYRRSLAK